jgi:hypothetical protein
MPRNRKRGSGSTPSRVRIPAAIAIDPGDPSLLVLSYLVPTGPPASFPVGEQEPGVIEPTAVYLPGAEYITHYETLKVE